MGRHSKDDARNPQHGFRASPRRLRTKAKALLAGGLVLGVGASVTMAAWTDNEYAQGTFTASIFNTESSVNLGTNWADNVTAPGPAMTFAGTGMSPTATRYAPFWIRSKAGSVAGTVALAAATTNNATFAAALELRVVTYTSGSCGAGLFISGAPYVVGSFAAPATLTTAGALAQALVATPGPGAGTPIQYCFQVSMRSDAANTLQDQSITVTWHLVATSTL